MFPTLKTNDKTFKNIRVSFMTVAPRTFHGKFLCRDTYREWPSRLAACSFAFKLQQPQLLLVCECMGVHVFCFFFFKPEDFPNSVCLNSESGICYFVLPTEDFR